MSTTATYGVYVRVRVRPETRDEFIRLVTELAANVKANEPDTLVYEFFQAQDPDEFVFFECFTDEAAFERHQNMDYHVAMSDAARACLSEDPHMEPLKCITARA